MVEVFIRGGRSSGGCCGGGEAEKRVRGELSTEAHHGWEVKKVVIGSRREEDKRE